MQVWLQEFAWTEKSKPTYVAVRNQEVHQPGQEQDQQAHDVQDELEAEPMFCFETAINMLYWSALVYDCDEVS